MTPFTAIVIGDESILVSCSDLMLSRGHKLSVVVTSDSDIVDWATRKGLAVLSSIADLTEAHEADWLFSIANLHMIPEAKLALGRKGAVNFHDGPLPAYAGLNAPVWALLNGESRHAVTWHLMQAGADLGDILLQQDFDIASDDTAFSLNSKCYGAGLESFEALLTQIETDSLHPQPQDLSQRSYFARDKRPAGAGRLNFSQSADDLLRLTRAMDSGGYWNPLSAAKLETGDGVFAISEARRVAGLGEPGCVLDRDEDSLVIACADGALRLSGLVPLEDGTPMPEAGTALPVFSEAQDNALRAVHEALAPHDGFWRKQLFGSEPAQLHLAARSGANPEWHSCPVQLSDHVIEAALIWARLSCGADAPADIAFSPASLQAARADAPAYFSDWVPLHQMRDSTTKAGLVAHVAELTEEMAARGTFSRDLGQRKAGRPGFVLPDIALAAGDAPIDGTVITLTPDTGQIHFDASRIDADHAELLARRLEHVARWLSDAPGDAPLADCPAIADGEAALMAAWNATETGYDTALTIPAAFEAQAALTPDATAIVFEDQTISYAALNARAGAIALALAEAGVGTGAHVGLYTRRSIDMVAGALAIMKLGAAYIPLDPAYPADRIAHYITDGQAQVILTQTSLAQDLPASAARTVILDEIAAASDMPSRARAEDIAYLIYTSGSTGLPKGVMVSHRNVINFFAGMDRDIDMGLGQTWAAVTSMAFDISVLELFYTLARGFKIVLMGDENRAAVSNGPIRLPGRKIDFNLFYWGNDDGVGRDKYALLLEGAKFADAHGFNAVWTPERHFHAFGGPYPNPSVTGAAVAAVTRNLSVRAGSCVAPLHHTARIAEEWAVIDNLTNGRAGLAIASGWQPDDFVLRPENTPPENKPAMYRAIDDLRKLWRGETVDYPTADGTPHAVLTQPRPVSPELPVWVTTAGNPQTWKEAGEIGAHVLTHLLGQSIDEVADKIQIYHKALRDAGHDPEDFQVTLMLHSYLAADRETARDVARGPMKDYLRSAAGLIKQYAWAFPAFKRPEGVKNPFEVDLGSLGDEEMDAILDFAFDRYFEESGLFGTIEDALARVEQVKRIGVTEIACLIDYGIPVPKVLEGLRPLAQVLKEANAPADLAADDFSLAAQLIRHEVSHLQCTPSMAQIIALNDEARMALSGVKQLFFGGEALPGALVRDLRKATRARITNMYGPTETTIWSSTETVTDDSGATIPIGRPIANTTLHVLDSRARPVPIGVPGELAIGGDGVTPGYWQRDDVTADRFIHLGKDRVYRTGDLVCRRLDGTLDFLGRNDHQIKIRGQRIELGEIEAVMTSMQNVTQAIVIDRKDAQGNTTLAGYYTAHAPVAEAALRAHLAETLPDVMVPAALMQLDAFPLTPNRKVDRKALPEPRSQRPAEVTAPVSAAPEGDTETRIADIWRRILGLAQVGSEDNFFAIGGHSLLAVQAHREIKSAFDRPDLSITDIFRFPTLSALAKHLAAADAVAETPPPADAPSRGEVMSKRKAMRANRATRVG